MADAVMIEFKGGFGSEQYDPVNAAVNPPGNPPPGLLFHSAGPSPDGGWRILDVWEDRASFDRFFEGTLQPKLIELLGPEALSQGEPPEITGWAIHNHSGAQA